MRRLLHRESGHRFAHIIVGHAGVGVGQPQAEQAEGFGVVEHLRRADPQRPAIGELLTCPYCLAPWISGALVAGHILAPVPTRVVTTVFALTAAADWMSLIKAKLGQLEPSAKPAPKQPPRVVTVQ